MEAKNTETQTVTVIDALRLALPLDTQPIAGQNGLNQPVRWAVTVSLGAALPYLEGGELVLVAPGEGDLSVLIKACAAAGSVGVVASPPLSPLAIATADTLNMPLLQIPTGSRVRDIERTLFSLLLDRQGHSERLSAQINQQLMQLASENVGLDRLMHSLAKAIGKAVVVQDKNLRIKHAAVSPPLAEVWDALTEFLKDRRSLPDSLRDRHKLPRHTAAVALQVIRDNSVTRLITPIVNQGIGRGFLSFVAPSDDAFDDVDMLVIQHGAALCALEMARAKAVSEVEKKLRSDFLTSLMSGTVSESEAQAEGDRFGHDMNAPHVALVLTWYGDKRPSNRRLETLVNGLVAGQSATLLSQLRETELRLFLATDSAEPIHAARTLAEDIDKAAQREYREAKIAIGIGSAAKRIWEWRASYREAANAADIARRLQSDVPLYAGDLGIYTLLTRSDFRDDLRLLRDRMIGNLLKYDERQRADLLQTLEAFFQCHGNHTQTAELLSVHRNTLFYRMNRIADITGLDLNQPDVRLAVHLSLKIHRLLGSDD